MCDTNQRKEMEAIPERAVSNKDKREEKPKADLFRPKPPPIKLPIIFIKSPSIREELHLTLYDFNIDEQVIIRMYYHIEMTVSEIARICKISPSYIVGSLIVYSERLKRRLDTINEDDAGDDNDLVDIKELFDAEFTETKKRAL